MAKPFKSEFDLMAEAYGTINRSKQAVINEHTSARSVIGYPPQLIKEDIDYGPSGEGKQVHPDEESDAEKEKREKGALEDDRDHIEDLKKDEKDDTEYEDEENPVHVRLDGMVHQELFSQLQKALTAVVADLHADGEEFEVSDVIDYLGSKMA